MRKRWFGNIFRRSEGSTTVEYALILPVLLLFVMGILEYCMIMYASSVLDGATANAARLAKTGYNNTANSGYCASPTQTQSQYITCIMQGLVSGLMNPANLTISSKSYATFGDIGQPEPYTDVNHLGHYVVGDPYTDVNGNGQWDADMGAAGLGGAGDIVVYTVSYPWPIMTPIMKNFIGTNGILTLSASAVVKNEPYNTQ